MTYTSSGCPAGGVEITEEKRGLPAEGPGPGVNPGEVSRAWASSGHPPDGAQLKLVRFKVVC